MPTHRFSPEQMKDELILKKAIRTTKELLIKKYGKHGKKSQKHLLQSIDSLIETTDFTHSKEGLGVFLSDNLFEIIQFPFQVHQKIKIDTSFALMELFYYLFNDFDYSLLSIQKKEMRFFNGEGSTLTETVNNDFPLVFNESYEYAKPDIIRMHGSTILKQFEREKTVLQEKQRINFFKLADDKLKPFIENSKPFLVAGGKQELSEFLEATNNLQHITAKISKNNLFKDEFHLGELAWEQLSVYKQKIEQLKIRNLSELWGQNLLAFGIDDVWKAAYSGNCDELMLDKTYHQIAFFTYNGKYMSKDKPQYTSHYTIIDNPFEEIVSLVLQKRGKVIFTGSGKLNEYNGIALKLRYTKS